MQTGTLKRNASLIQLLMRLLDFGTILLSGYFGYWLRFESWGMSTLYLVTLLSVSFLASIMFHLQKVYYPIRGRPYRDIFPALGIAWTMTMLLFIFYLFAFQESAEYSRIWLGFWYGLGLALLWLQRVIVYFCLHYARASGYNIRHIVVIGEGSLLERVRTALGKSLWTGYKVERHILWDEATTYDMAMQQELLGYIKEKSIDEVWITMPLEKASFLKEVMNMLSFCTCIVRLVPDIFGTYLINYSVTEIAGLPVVNLRDTPMSGFNQLVKWIEDKLCAVVILLLTSPILVIVAIAVKYSSKGPVFFKQERYGLDGKSFKVLKFRSMKVHQESRGQVTQATKNDNRITKVGAFIRRTSLDELPQIFNVLLGNMSLVGPRPHAAEHNEYYKNLVPGYMQRHLIKPGITGWAQVNGFRGETNTLEKMQKRVEYDLYYIENWSLALDLKIIFLTIFKGFVHKNAY